MSRLDLLICLLEGGRGVLLEDKRSGGALLLLSSGR